MIGGTFNIITITQTQDDTAKGKEQKSSGLPCCDDVVVVACRNCTASDDWSMGAKNYVSGQLQRQAEASVDASGCCWAIGLAGGPNLGTVPGTIHWRLLQLHLLNNNTCRQGLLKQRKTAIKNSSRLRKNLAQQRILNKCLIISRPQRNRGLPRHRLGGLKLPCSLGKHNTSARNE